MLSEKKKRSDLGLDIFLPKSKCSLKKKKKKKVFTPSRPLSESKTVYAVFEGGPLKSRGGLRDYLIRLTQYPPLLKAAHGQAQAQLTSAYKLRLLFGPDIAGPNFGLLTCIVKFFQSAARELVGFRYKYIGVNGSKYVGPSGSF